MRAPGMGLVCRVCLLGLLDLLGAFGCSGAGADVPSVALASSYARQTAFQKLLAAWSRGSRAERIAQKPELTAFRQVDPAEPLSRTVDALLAWVALEEGDFDGAAQRAALVQAAAGPGNTSDLARAVQGAALRRRGRFEEALVVLSPLVSKLLDGYARDLLNEEIIESALGARRYPRALQLMRVWLREEGAEERGFIEARIEEKLKKVPVKDLLDLLDQQTKGVDVALLASEEQEMRRIVAQRLAAVALERREADLAKRLLASVGPLLGDQGDAVARLATGGTRARVEARTVGLLLSLRNDETRRRGAEVADGVTHGLGLPGSAARLVSRDDRGDPGRLDEALSSLSAEGASILIAGVDEAESTAAARFAESNQIPVLLLTPPAGRSHPGRPQGEAPGRFTFLLGVDPSAVEDVLASALAARGAAPVAILTGDTTRRSTTPREVAAVRDCSEVAVPWKPLGVAGIVLDAGCASQAMVAVAPLRVRFAVGFDAGLFALPAGSLVATSGLYPIDAARPPAAFSAWKKNHAVEPSFWAALGRDAAVLAWTGVQSLPTQGTEDPKEVATRRAQAADVLAGAEAELWTSDAKGFAGARQLPRPIGVREVVKER